MAEESSTIDPCHVIRLIRTLIPEKASEPESPSLPCEGEPERSGNNSEQETVPEANAGNSESLSELSDDDREKEKETAGCVLWDLASSEEHAKFMVQNHFLSVAAALLNYNEPSARLKELALGIMANIACHHGQAAAMACDSSLIPSVIRQLFQDDPPALTEACRLLSTCIRQTMLTSTSPSSSSSSSSWLLAACEPAVIQRVTWMTANALHRPLIQQGLQLLSVVAEVAERGEGAEEEKEQRNRQGREAAAQFSASTAADAFEPLPEQGDNRQLHNTARCAHEDADLAVKAMVGGDGSAMEMMAGVMSDEVDALQSNDGSADEGVLDACLQLAETLSLLPCSACHVASHHQLISSLARITKAAASYEHLSDSALASAVVLANAMVERSFASHALLEDASFLSSLFSLLPSSRTDTTARSALFSIFLHVVTHNVSRRSTANEVEGEQGRPKSSVGDESTAVCGDPQRESEGEEVPGGDEGEGAVGWRRGGGGVKGLDKRERGEGGGEGSQARDGSQLSSSHPSAAAGASPSSAVVLAVCEGSQVLVEDLLEQWGEVMRRKEGVAGEVDYGREERGTGRSNVVREPLGEENKAMQKEFGVVLAFVHLLDGWLGGSTTNQHAEQAEGGHCSPHKSGQGLVNADLVRARIMPLQRLLDSARGLPVIA